eukprot:GAHX01003106.1.p1 GENE.GAHX01003106.1~~GAHX01003106.1.p1  ORF type:complete len:79 (-),score=0.70 GAHX01003106.1:31-267(-)
MKCLSVILCSFYNCPNVSCIIRAVDGAYSDVFHVFFCGISLLLRTWGLAGPHKTWPFISSRFTHPQITIAAMLLPGGV